MRSDWFFLILVTFLTDNSLQSADKDHQEMRAYFLPHISKKMPRYRREDRAMPLYISIRIKFYNGIERFLCHSTHFLMYE